MKAPGNSTPKPPTRTRLMEAALLAFSEKGFDATSIRDIAERAKANSALIQYHFGGKEGLYRESLRHAFQCARHRIQDLPPPPAPDAPQARAVAMESLRNFITVTLEDFFLSHGKGLHMPIPIEEAASTLWNREMQDPRPSVEAMILESIQPFRDYLSACVRALRPDLDEETTLRMCLSIQGQLLLLHKNPGIIRLVRGHAYEATDIQSLANHVTTFSLRGLGIPEAFPPQGA